MVVRGQAAARKKVKSADIVLYHKPGLPLAVVEAKANQHEVGKSMQQALDYARLLDVPFAFASNGAVSFVSFWYVLAFSRSCNNPTLSLKKLSTACDKLCRR